MIRKFTELLKEAFVARYNAGKNYRKDFELLSEWTNTKELNREIRKINKAENNPEQIISDNKFETEWNKLGVPQNACVMTPEDLTKMLNQVVSMSW